MKCRLCAIIALSLLLSVHSYAQVAATCSDSALVVADQLKQLERSQLNGPVRLTNGASACVLPALPPVFAATNTEKVIAAGQTGSVDTGFHGRVVVRSAAVLKLKPGVYKLSKLTLEWDSKIIVDTAASDSIRPLELQVADGLTWMDRAKINWPGVFDSIAASRIIVAVLGGNIQLGYDSKFLGTLLAPHSNVTILDRALLRGRLLSSVQTWGWDTKGVFGSLATQPSWISTRHSILIQGPRYFWTNRHSINVVWSIDGVVQDTGLVQLFSSEGRRVITRCFGNACDSVIAMVDWTAPMVRILSPTNGYTTRNPILSLVWSADGLVTTDVVPLQEGSNSFTRYASDSAGNRDSAAIKVTLDLIPPQVKIITPLSGAITNESKIQVAWKIDGILQPADSVVLEEGLNLIRRFASDSVGNQAGDSVSVMLDTKPPVITIIEPVNGVSTEANRVLVRWKVDSESFEEWANLTIGINRIEKSAVDAVGNRATAAIQVIRVGEVVLPEPIATVYPAARISDLSFGADFLIKGETAVQAGFQTDSTKPMERAVLRGVVVDQSRKPLVNVHVSILDGSIFGATRTRAEGNWDLLVGGGLSRIVIFEKSGFLTSQRLVSVEGGDVIPLDTIVLMRMDSAVTEVRANASIPQVVAGSIMFDKDGSRRSVVIVPSGTNIEVENEDGTRASLSTVNLRITEYTVGELGPKAMPADLPRTTGYTFCADVTVDEVPKANHLHFSKPVPFYVDNFLGFPIGWPVPVGSYDRKLGDWKELPNGRIIRILGKDEAGLAQIDINGDGVEDGIDSLSALGFTHEEMLILGGRYLSGASLMRALTNSFSPIDLNYPLITLPDIPPDDPDDDPVDSSECENGCEIDVNNQIMRERIQIPGTDIELVYNSEETEGRITGKIVRFNLWNGFIVPENLVQVRYSINVLGRIISGSRPRSQLASEANHEATLIWDGLDAWGRRVYGKHSAVATIEYEYVAYYASSARTFNSAGRIIDTSEIVARGNIIRTKDKRLKLTGSPVDPLRIPGWKISSINTIDPDQLASQSVSRAIVSPNPPASLLKIAGGGASRIDSGSGKDMSFSRIADIVTTPDGKIYFSTNDLEDSAHSGIWETSISGAKTKKIFPRQTSGMVNVCDVAMPEQLAITPSGIILFSSHTVNGVVFCSFDPVKKITSAFAALSSWFDVYDIAYSRYRGIIVSRGYGRLGQVSFDGSYTEIASEYESTYGIASTNDGDVLKHSYARNTIEKIGVNVEVTVVAAGSNEFGGGYLGFSSGDRRAEPFSEMGYQVRSGLCQAKNGDLWYSAWNVLYRISNGWVEIMAGNGRQSVSDGAPRNNVQLLGAGEPSGPGIAPLQDGVVFTSYSYQRYENSGVRENPEIYYIAERKLQDSWFYSPDGESLVKYDSLWRHIKTIAIDGRTLKEIEYGESDLLHAVTDSLGRRALIQRDAEGRVLGIVSPDGRVTNLTYASNGTLEKIALPNGTEWKFSTSSNGLVHQIENPQGLISTYGWDALGRLTSDHSSDGAILEISNSRSYRNSENRVIGRFGSVKTSNSIRTPEGGLLTRSVDAMGRIAVTQVFPEGDRVDTTKNGNIVTTRLIVGSPQGIEIVTASPNGNIISREKRETEYLYRNPSDFRTIESRTEYIQTEYGQKIIRRDYARKLVHTQHPDGSCDTSWLNSLGQVVAVRRSGTGYRVFEYDQNGNRIAESVALQGVMQPLWRREFDGKSNLLKEWKAREPGQPMIVTGTHEYDSYGRRVYSINGRGERTDYGYDSRGNQNLVRDPRGAIVSKEFDVRGRVVNQWDPEEMAKPVESRRAERWQYDFDGNMIQHTDKFGDVDKNLYLESGLLAMSIKGVDTVRFNYDSVGNLAAEVSAKGESTFYEYDANGMRTQVLRKKSGRERMFEQGDQIENTWYDASNRPVRMDRNGVSQWEKGYDQYGRLQYNYISAWEWSMWEYDELGRQKSLFTNEHIFQNVFDELGRVVARLRDNDTIEVLKLGLDGSVLERRRPGSGTEVSVYDAMGVVVRRSDSTGQTLIRILGAGGVDSMSLDAKGNSKVSIANALGRVVSIRDERGNIQRFGYDDHGELAWLEDNEGNRTRFETMRWESGDVRKTVKTFFSDGKSEVVAYGAMGELLYKVDGNGLRTENKYDRWGRLSEINYRTALGVAVSDVIRFKYDDFGRMIYAQRGTDFDSAEYDQYGRVVRELHTIAGSTYEISHTFEDGNRVRVSMFPDGSVIRRSVSKGLGVDSIWYGGAIMAEFGYERGREIFRRLANNIEAIRAYDVGGRMSSLGYFRNGISIAGFGFRFDSIGNLNTIQRSHEAEGDEVMYYTEDHQLEDWSRGNLSGPDYIETPQNRQSWLLDSRGNWGEWYHSGFHEVRFHSGANELLERRVGEFGALHAWDSAGNLVSDGLYEYTWSHRGYLKSISAGMNHVAQYEYDPLGRRTVKITGALTTVSVYDGRQCVWQKVTGSGTDTTKVFLYSNYIDEPIAMVRRWGASADTVWYLQGNNYNVEAITDHIGSIIERYAYTPFGEAIAYIGEGADGKWFTADDASATGSMKGNSLTFQGRELDAETGVYYFRNRYYSPQMGQFLTRDPLGYGAKDINMVRMERNNPITRVDPQGLWSTMESLWHYWYGGGASVDISTDMLQSNINEVAGVFDIKQEVISDVLSGSLAGSKDGVISGGDLVWSLGSVAVKAKYTCSRKKCAEKECKDYSSCSIVYMFDEWFSDPAELWESVAHKMFGDQIKSHDRDPIYNPFGNAYQIYANWTDVYKSPCIFKK